MNENWSIKLLVGDGDVVNYNSFELVYNQSSNTKYKLTQGTGAISGQQPLPLNHRSDDEAPIHARLVEANKTGRFEISVLDDVNTPPEWDTILNNIHTLNRHMSGADSTAARYSIYGTAQKVRLAVLPDGATNTTYFELQSGWADVSSACYSAKSQQGTDSAATIGAWFIPINFTFKTGGEGNTFTLRNDLASSPHFIEDSDSDGLADGWSLVGTPIATTATITSRWLIGGRGQKLETDASTDEGIQSTLISASAGSDAVAYIWLISLNSGATAPGDTVTVLLKDGIGTTLDSNSTPDRTIISSSGDTFSRYIVSGNNGANAGFILQARRLSTDATQITLIYLDAAYLQVGTLTAPDGWSSTAALVNRYDPSVSEGNINYLDVWGLPGDLPALSHINNAPDSGKATKYLLGAFSDNVDTVADVAHWHESDDFTDTLATWTTGTGTIGNHYFQNATTSDRLIYSSINNKYARQQWRVYVLAYTSNINATIKIEYYSGSSFVSGVKIAETETGQLTQTSKWQYVDLGVLNLVDVLSQDVSFNLSEELVITQDSSQTIRFDGVLYLPTELGANIAKHYDLLSATGQTVDYIPQKDNVYDNATGINLNAIGQVPNLIPGNVMNRYIFVWEDGTDDEVDITTTSDITLTITPRASHLLGTG